MSNSLNPRRYPHTLPETVTICGIEAKLLPEPEPDWQGNVSRLWTGEKWGVTVTLELRLLTSWCWSAQTQSRLFSACNEGWALNMDSALDGCAVAFFKAWEAYHGPEEHAAAFVAGKLGD